MSEQPKIDNPIASLGGKASAAKLTPEERRERAKLAAEARWGADLPQATHEGVLRIGDIPCYVLENGERVISTRGIMKALGRRWRGRKYSGTELPVFLEAKNLKPFISEELSTVLSVVIFKTTRGMRSEGFKAKLLPMLCETYLRARDADALTPQQAGVAIKADILMRGLAQVGIIALIDEATGYQETREKDALAKILEAFVAKELRPWVKTFPLEYYVQLCRLRGVEYRPDLQLPRYFGHLTNDLIYRRLAPGVFDELRAKNPVVNGKRQAKHFQWLTDNIGNPKLLQHLGSIVTLMKLHDNYEAFKTTLEKIHPPYREAPLIDWYEKESGNQV